MNEQLSDLHFFAFFALTILLIFQDGRSPKSPTFNI